MRFSFIALLALGLAACGSSPPTDAGADVALDVSVDAPTAPDVVRDPGADAPSDVNVAQDAPALPDVASTDAPAPDAPTPDAPTADAPTLDAPEPDATDGASPDAAAPADVMCGGPSQPCCSLGGATSRCAPGLYCRSDGNCGACSDGLTMCGAQCADTGLSNAHCGACDHACAPSEACSGGECRSLCAAPLAWCAGACVRVGQDVNHCTACGARCALANATAGCSDGACMVAACAAGFGDCDGNAANGCEADLRTSATHCGVCGNGCAGGGVGAVSCTMGTCGLACPTGRGDCDADPSNGCETDLNVSASHCSRCDVACPDTGLGATCTAGACGTSACAAATGDCDGVRGNGCETNLGTSLAHCGACGNACARANATTACVAGACTVTACAAGFGDCDGNPDNGCEASLRADVNHCGSCVVACATDPSATPACVAGACRIASCASGRADCNGLVADGCEVNTSSATNHCGACATTCVFDHAAASCSGGGCVMGACAGSFADCDGLSADGCEVNMNTNRAHCGGCGRRCVLANATPACVGGACAVASCAAGFADCDRAAANGCEVDTRTSARHCGACGRACATGQVCAAGACVSVCGAGQTDCAGACASLATDVNHCGACGRVCTTANGVAACVAGACAVGSCSAGFGNCDGNAANGCETNLSTSSANCAACGAACAVANGSGGCSAGRCVVTACNAGFANCDGLTGNGCEVDLRSSASNCGGCGTACAARNGTPRCSGGACGVASCNAGYGDCNGAASDGCETALTSTSNCGGCGTTCPVRAHASAACNSGTCGLRCNTDYRDCNGNASDGCETHVSGDTHNCGSCGNRCYFGFACSHGTCF